MEVRYAIIGAGPTGLGAAVRLQECGERDFVVLDSLDRPGGLATSYTDPQGFTWDLGGHVQFSHYDRFNRHMDAALGKEGWCEHRRESWIWFRDRFVRYPFQNNLHFLRPEDKWQYARGLFDAWVAAQQESPPPANFREWILRTFGTGLADAFLLPYNFKVWAYPPEELGFYWIGERVAVPEFTTVLKGICLGAQDDGWGPNHSFRFPLRGGTGAIWRAVAAWLPSERLLLNSHVVGIDPQRRRLTCADGRTVAYRTLISTMPVDVLSSILGDARAMALAARLRFSSTHVLGFGLRGRPPESIASKSWMYFPDLASPYYRVTVFSNYSPNNTPDPDRYWSLMAEVAESPRKPVAAETLEAEVLGHLTRDGLVPDPAAVVSVWRKRLERGYPTPSLDRDQAVHRLLPYLEGLGVFSRGRFGAWKYEVSNQDHSYAQGYELADRLLGRSDRENGVEPTLNRPGHVNSKRNP